jgi:hypothetical protein
MWKPPGMKSPYNWATSLSFLGDITHDELLPQQVREAASHLEHRVSGTGTIIFPRKVVVRLTLLGVTEGYDTASSAAANHWDPLVPPRWADDFLSWKRERLPSTQRTFDSAQLSHPCLALHARAGLSSGSLMIVSELGDPGFRWHMAILGPTGHSLFLLALDDENQARPHGRLEDGTKTWALVSDTAPTFPPGAVPSTLALEQGEIWFSEKTHSRIQLQELMAQGTGGICWEWATLPERLKSLSPSSRVTQPSTGAGGRTVSPHHPEHPPPRGTLTYCL